MGSEGRVKSQDCRQFRWRELSYWGILLGAVQVGYEGHGLGGRMEE